MGVRDRRPAAYRNRKYAWVWLRDALEKKSRIRETLFPRTGHGVQTPSWRRTMAVDPARAKSLFLTASDLADPAERAAYLDRECGGDADLRARVEALLQANDD